MVVAIAAKWRDAGHGGLDQHRRCVRRRATARTRRSSPGAVAASSRYCRGETFRCLGSLAPLPQGRPVAFAAVVEAAVEDGPLGVCDVEALQTDIERDRRRRRLDEVGAELLADCQRRGESVRHIGIERDRSANAEAKRPDVRTPAERPRRAAERGRGSTGVGPGHRLEQQCAVLQRARHRPGVIEARGQRHDAPQGDQTARRLDRRRAGQCRWDAQGAGRVGACRRGHRARRQRRGRAAARAARRALERPRIADLVSRAAPRELVRVRWPSRIMPWARRRAQTSESTSGRSSRRLLDAVRGRPATANRSFSPTGIPHSGGSGSGRSRSARAAASSAESSYTRTHALIDAGSPSWLWVPSRSAMRARQALTSSEADSPPFAISAEASAMLRSAASTTARRAPARVRRRARTRVHRRRAGPRSEGPPGVRRRSCRRAARAPAGR